MSIRVHMQHALFGGAPPTKGGIRTHTHTRRCFLDDSFTHYILSLLDLHIQMLRNDFNYSLYGSMLTIETCSHSIYCRMLT